MRAFFTFFSHTACFLLVLGFLFSLCTKKRKKEKERKDLIFLGGKKVRKKRTLSSFAPLSYTEREKRTTTTVFVITTDRFKASILVAELYK